MDTAKIEQLLQCFYEAQTTDEEERQLRGMLQSGDLPQYLQGDRELFFQLADASRTPIPQPEGLEQRLSKLIDEQAERQHARHFFIRRRWIAAASVLILIGVGISYFNQSSTTKEISDPQEAYEMTCQALALFSTTLNEGMAQLDQASDAAIEVQTTINALLH